MKKNIVKLNENAINRIVAESIKKRRKTGSIQWNGSRTDAEEDGVDRYGNPMFKIKDKNGKTKRVQSFSFRPKISESALRQIVVESVKRVLKEAESGGWIVDSSEAQEAYNLAVKELGEETINSAIVRCLGDEALSQCLAYIFRQYDFRQWKSRFEDEEDYPEDDDYME